MFLLSQNDENQSENGSKNSKIRFRARPPAEPQKKMLQTKKLKSKSWKTRGFSLFACRFWTGAFTNRCLPYCFLQCFLKASVTTYQKTGGFGRKMPPPGKPVTFYECHPEDHAPAPSVRADLWWFGGWFTIVLTTLLCFRIFLSCLSARSAGKTSGSV